MIRQAVFLTGLLVFSLAVFVQADPGHNDDDEAEIKANLNKLGKEDRLLAEAQKYCPIMEDTRLGGHGEVVKILIKEKPVFLCCKGCKKKALASPDKTLAKVEELKAKNKKAEPKK